MWTIKKKEDTWHYKCKPLDKVLDVKSISKVNSIENQINDSFFQRDLGNKHVINSTTPRANGVSNKSEAAQSSSISGSFAEQKLNG